MKYTDHLKFRLQCLRNILLEHSDLHSMMCLLWLFSICNSRVQYPRQAAYDPQVKHWRSGSPSRQWLSKYVSQGGSGEAGNGPVTWRTDSVFSRWFVCTSKPGWARKFGFWEPSRWLSQGYDMVWSCDSGALTSDRPFPAAPVFSRAESVTMALARCGNWTRLGAFLPPLALKWLQNSQSDLYILMNFPTLKKKSVNNNIFPFFWDSLIQPRADLKCAI